MIDRRGFIAHIGALCGAAAVMCAKVTRADGEKVRSVSFVHTHTGEKLTAVYWKDGQYQLQVLEQVNHLLRDFRTNEIHAMDPALLDVLFELRTKVGSHRAFHVISGYRSPKTNEMLRRSSSGVAEHSMHMLGKAIDVRLESFPTQRLAEVARTLRRGGVGYYRASDFVHVDTGRVRYW
ncbi:MAG TPA: DUF882 domain-containing protein [Steroidobacteraceae bacterium]|jgi:uncharacterized protein YcbK (DUF882 family)